MRRPLRALPLLVPLLLLASAAGAVEIRHAFADLDDALGPGGDLWEARYTVTGESFAADQGFSLLFDPGLYRDLEDPPPAAGPDWDLLVLQPDTGLPDFGLYDALALRDGASLDPEFRLRFVWLGDPSGPGAQPFSVNAFDAAGDLVAILETGTTVPEPGAALLLAAGLLGIAAGRRAS